MVESMDPEPAGDEQSIDLDWEMTYPKTRSPLIARCQVAPITVGIGYAHVEVRLFYNDQLLTLTRHSGLLDARMHCENLRKFLSKRGWVDCRTFATKRQAG